MVVLARKIVLELLRHRTFHHTKLVFLAKTPGEWDLKWPAVLLIVRKGQTEGPGEVFIPLSVSFPNQSNIPIFVIIIVVIIKATEH